MLIHLTFLHHLGETLQHGGIGEGGWGWLLLGSGLLNGRFSQSLCHRSDLLHDLWVGKNASKFFLQFTHSESSSFLSSACASGEDRSLERISFARL